MRRVGVSIAAARAGRIAVSELRGVDLTNDPANVAPTRSPEAPNMIREVPGKVRKRMGYRKTAQYDGAINGIFTLRRGAEQKIELIHAGTALYCGTDRIYEGMADSRSCAQQLGEHLFISDGRALIKTDGKTAAPAALSAYLPTIVISRSPSGGGKAYEGLNLIGSRWRESFLSDGVSAVYQLSYGELEDDITVELLSGGVWNELKRDTDYAFNATLGQVTFVSAPPAPETTGEDSVRITVKKTREEYRARIDSCSISVLYGVGGVSDRLFLTGCPDYPNYDWFSGMSDGCYFPLANYCILGQGSRVGGYSVVEGKLAAHKTGDADGRNVILREGKLTDDGKASFPTVGTMQGAAIVSPYSVAYLKTEPLFLSGSGIYAITPADANAERYTQCRSFYLGNALMNESGRQTASAVSFRDFYIIALGSKLYVLDSLMKAYEKGAPYSTHQYEAFVLCGINARLLAVVGDRLRFGTDSGEIMEFYTDPASPASYNDNGAPIEAYWDTPELAAGDFYHRGSFHYLAVRLRSASATSVAVSARIRGIWQALFYEGARLRYLSFENISFEKFSFSCSTSPHTAGRRLRLPRTDGIRLRFYNSERDEPFGVYDYALEYTAGGRMR